MNSKAYMNAYMKQRYDERRKYAVEKLGSACYRCASSVNLQFALTVPMLPTYRVINVGKLVTQRRERFEHTLTACVLVCTACTSLKERVKYDPYAHGTLASYRYCRCTACKDAKNAYQIEWKREARYKRQTINSVEAV